MPDLLRIDNHGPLIRSTNFWSTELALNGKLFCSVNAGAIRILLPPQLYPMLDEMRTGKECVLSLGPGLSAPRPDLVEADSDRITVTDPQPHGPVEVEILWDDGTRTPYSMQLTRESFDLLPGEPTPGREWTISVWTHKAGRPHKALERICHWRRVLRLPWLKPWAGGGVPASESVDGGRDGRA